VQYRNQSVNGARMVDLRHRQLPDALAVKPDVAVIVAGMNDTLRSDFDPVALRDDLNIAVTALQATGALVLITRFHDHGQVFGCLARCAAPCMSGSSSSTAPSTR
jgi:lysophospholipase L1-like esterase